MIQKNVCTKHFMKTIFLVLFISLCLFSCRKEDTLFQNGNTELAGNWINPQYSDTLVTYTRAETLIENEYGITFKSGDKLVVRQNGGWCGTPPITTADYEGTWSQEGSVVKITVGYWGGIAEYIWKIKSLNNHELVITVVSTRYQEGKK